MTCETQAMFFPAGYRSRALDSSSVLTEEYPNLFQFQWTKHVQRDQAFHYFRLPSHLGQKELKAKALEAIKRQAELELKYANGNAINVTTSDQGKFERECARKSDLRGS
jgi:hypothetical protein